MNKTKHRWVLARGAWPIRVAGTFCIVVGLAAAAGCAYVETVTSRTAPPDSRVELSANNVVLLHDREIPDYTCGQRLILQCERSGAVSYSCQCARP